jgi:hypothetical protein
MLQRGMKLLTFNPSNEGIHENVRLVIYNINTNSIHSKVEINYKEELVLEDEIVNSNPFNFKYKYQVMLNGKWKDATKYVSFVQENKLEKFLLGRLNLGDKQLNELVEMYVINYSETKFNNIKTAIFNVLRDIWMNRLSDHQNLKRFLKVLKNLDSLNIMWSNLKFYLTQVLIIKDKFRELSLDETHFDLLKKQLSANSSLTDFIKRQIEHADKSSLQLAYVLSGCLHSLLGERSTAASKFQKAINFETDFILDFKFDLGAHTYKELGSIKDFKNEINFVSDANYAERDMTILISLDVKFLRYYAASMFYAIIALKKYHFHFHVVGEQVGAISTITRAMKLFDDMVEFRRPENSPQKPSFSTETCPTFVKDPKTFYACARFIRAVFFMEHFNSDLFIIDADMFIDNDISPYLNKLQQYDMTLPYTMGMMNLYPWRRIMAGNVYMKNKDMSKRFMNKVRQYILQNIENPVSWTLDQNALDFAYQELFEDEQDINIGNSALFSRPMYQPSIRKLIEKD